MKRTTIAILLVLTGAGSGCDDDAGPEDLGEDTFESNSLADYDETSDDGSVGFFSVTDGALVAAADGDARHARLLRRGVNLLDGHVEVESAHITNGLIVFRYQNPSTFYFVAIRDDDASYGNMRDRNVELYRVLNGGEAWLAREDLVFPRGSVRTIGVRFVGSEIELLFDGAVVASVEDQMIPQAGRIGVGHDDQLTPGEASHFEALRWGAVD